MYGIEKLSELETILCYAFKDKNLLITALTHPSFSLQNQGASKNYQRLEFLGDSVLSFILTKKLFKLYPEEREGELARYRAVLVQGAGLSNLARKIQLPKFIRLSDAEYKAGGSNKDSILEDVFEALIGAIYLDSEVETTEALIDHLFTDLEKLIKEDLPHLNRKGTLQELIQHASPTATIEYSLLKSSGPDHNKSFTVNVLVNKKILGTGSGSSKKAAEEHAAIQALEILKSHPYSEFEP